MFEQKEEIQQAIDAVYAILEGLKPGDVLAHSQVRAAIGLEPHEGPWDHIVYRAFDRLEVARGIPFWQIRTVGYELLTPQRALEVIPLKRAKKAYRQWRKIERSIGRLPVKALTIHQRRVRAFTLDRAREQKRAHLRERRLIAAQLQSTTTRPKAAAAK
jgi:hypothetical protein